MATKNEKIAVRPIGDRVLVRPLTDRELGSKTKSGIYIPETAEKVRAETGVVVSVGEGKMTDDGKRLPMTVKVGDEVLFSKYGPDEFKFEGKEYYILSEGNILAIIG